MAVASSLDSGGAQTTVCIDLVSKDQCRVHRPQFIVLGAVLGVAAVQAGQLVSWEFVQARGEGVGRASMGRGL